MKKAFLLSTVYCLLESYGFRSRQGVQGGRGAGGALGGRARGADWDDEGAGVLPRSRFMAAVGMFVSAHSALVIIAQWVAVFVYSACQRT